MKKIYTIITFLFLTSFWIVNVNAQEENETIIVTPAVSYINPGEDITFRIVNNTSNTFKFEITPIYFDLDLEERILVKSSEEVPANTFRISNLEGEILAGESFVQTIAYVGNSTTLIPGILVKPSDESSDQFGIRGEIASVIIDLSLSEADKESIETKFELKPESTFLGLSIGKKYSLSSFIQNNSNKIIKAEGEIHVTTGDKYLSTYPQSDQLIDSLYPSDQKEFNEDFVDSRPWYRRIGRITFTQEYKINGNEIKIEHTIISLPVELFISVGAIIILVASIFFIVRPLVNKNKKKGSM